MTLRISLRDGEQLVVNGAVLKAHGRVVLGVESQAAILRGSDLMPASAATTPARRLYHAAVCAYIEPDNAARHHETIIKALQAAMATLDTPVAAAACAAFARKVAGGDYYRALAECRALIAMEGALPGGIPALPAGIPAPAWVSAAALPA
jgi:flagellar protein FlbT